MIASAIVPQAKGVRNSGEIAKLGRLLCRLVKERGVVHVSHPETVKLLKTLGLDGIHRFADSHELDVQCRARGTVFDFTHHESAP